MWVNFVCLFEFFAVPWQHQTFAVESARLPTLKSLYEDEEVLDKLPVAKLGREALENTRPRPVSPLYSDMSLEVAGQFNASLKGEVPGSAPVTDPTTRCHSERG